jgi:DNA polymerase I-like protein with 3'-5' exonuclease and polymerase domains
MPLITPNSTWVRPSELPDLRGLREFAIDTEEKDDGLANDRGPGWVYGAGHVAGVSCAWREGDGTLRSIYAPVRHPDSDCFDHDAVRRWLKDHFNCGARVIFQNGPYDLGWIEQDFGVKAPEHIDDIGCMAVMIDETHREYSLDAISRRLGRQGKNMRELIEAAHAYGYPAAKVKEAIGRMPARYVGPYAEQDAVETLLGAEDMRPELAEQGLLNAYQLEMDLIPLIHAMRKRGIRMDMDRLYANRDKLYEMRDETLKEIQRRCGGRQLVMEDIRSEDWLHRTFGAQGVEYRGDDGSYNFQKDWMRQGYLGRYQDGKEGHWLPLLVARAKQCHDSADKFIDGFLINFAHNGRIHASINQFLNEDGGTRTHRFSYSDPPLQQMPSRGEMLIKTWLLTKQIVEMIRVCFLPERGEKWFSPDYSQQEYRLMVHYAAMEELTKADWAAQKYIDDVNTDFHNMVVEMTGLPRQRAKDVNFAKSYGAGLKKFAAMTGMTLEESEKTITQYDTEMPFIKQLNERCDKAAQQRGYIVMLDGARMHFNTWECAKWIDYDVKRAAEFAGYKQNDCHKDEALERTRTPGHPWFGKPLRRANTRKAMNGLIQGGSARMGKRAMRDMWREGYVPLVQMHDEFPNSVAKEKDGKRIAEIMRSAFKGRVPFKVDEEYGPNWGEAKYKWKEVKAAA